ncbi:50S ribosomal protein L25 [Pasteuria penetrans]|uniref:50S ribosomal protein L25 n=1 Tax=Pasteuria penetrans TaxID=86005 RepID=UPI000FA95293|nr:50S ribosomal protein L25 [Pasteuria penetrans]
MIVLEAEPRSSEGPKRALNRLRKNGRVPGVVYGGGNLVGSVHVDQATFSKEVLGSKHSFFTLRFKGEDYLVLVRSVQRDPVWGKLLHIDFLTVQPDRRLEVEVPIRLMGSARGVKEGGILQTGVRSLLVRCLPHQMPSDLTVDVTPLSVGQTLTSSHVSLPEGVQLISESDVIVVSVVQKQRSGDGRAITPKGDGAAAL